MKLARLLLCGMFVLLIGVGSSCASSYYLTASTTSTTISSNPCFVRGLLFATTTAVTLTIYDNTTVKTKIYVEAGKTTVPIRIEDIEWISCDTNLKIVSSITDSTIYITIFWKRK